MDSFTSSEPLVPSSTRLSSVGEQSAAVDRLIALGRQRIRVFDQDLSQTGWSSAARAELLARFLKPQGRRLDVILHDTRYLESSCPRLLSLLRNFSHCITVYRTGTEARHAADPLVIVDESHHLHRFDWSQSGASLVIEHPEMTRPLANRFDEIWATGEPGINATVLGL